MQTFIVDRVEKVLTTFEDGFRRSFKGDTPEKYPWFSRIWLAGLLLAGIYAWGLFLDFGALPLTLKDWGDITGPRLAILQDAIKKNALPLNVSNQKADNGHSDRFLSIPDQVLSPQVLILRFSSLSQFVFIDVLLLYLAGFWGLLWLRRKFSLSLIAFTILFILFNFNGHILAHYAVGHFTWGGYFLSRGLRRWRFAWWKANAAGAGSQKWRSCSWPYSCRDRFTSTSGASFSWLFWPWSSAAPF